ncbi:MAG: cytochrome c biogenesis protein CcdA [Bacteroidota bacterium]
MKKLMSLSIILLLTGLSYMLPLHGMAQQVNPVTWELKTERVDDTHARLIMDASIEDNWHLYTMNFPDGGPIPLYFSFDESDHYRLIEDVKESPEPVESFDDVFGVDIKYQEGHATYTQKIEILSTEDFTITGLIDGQACFEDGQCVLVSKDLSFNIKGKPAKSEAPEDVKKEESTEHKTESADKKSEDSEQSEAPEETSEDIAQQKSKNAQPADSQTKDTQDDKKEKNEKSGLIGFILIAIGGGLAGVLTPCVFPMIPMTVSFFMQGNQSRANGIFKALVFGISIMLLYTLVGLIVSLTSAGADLTTTLSTSWVANSIFFVLFIIFAFSFFGLFEIVLPSSLANKTDRQVDKGGMLASFFMALTLVIVSFSCTGPIVGALLVKGAASGSWIEPTLGMAGFGFGFALPFTLLAISPGWLKKLPKSGGWMNSVKVVFAFILLAFSMKFISNIDQAYNLNLLSRDLYLSIWIVLFILLGIYLLGKIKFSHDSDVPHIGVFRLLLVIASFSFAVYLIPGLFGANLSSISAIIPPKTAQKFDITASGAAHSTTQPMDELCEEPLYSENLHYPSGTRGYFDYDQARECAIEQDKPLLLYFTGHSCSNCKKMQSEVWSDPRVMDYINNKYITAKLYVDERTEVAEDKWFTSEVDGKMKKTLGKMNMDRQIRDFDVNSQPYYVIIDPETEEMLTEETLRFETDPEKFIDFLDKGLEAFDK